MQFLSFESEEKKSKHIFLISLRFLSNLGEKKDLFFFFLVVESAKSESASCVEMWCLK